MTSKSATEHRLFLGIALTEEMQQSLEAFALPHRRLKGLRWIPGINLHITTVFFGNTPAEMLPNLISLLQLALEDIPTFELHFRRFRYAPKPREPRMIWAQFDKNETYIKAVQSVNKHFSQIRPEHQSRKKPIPHITLARLRNFRELYAIDLDVQLEPSYLPVREMILWESTLRPEGAYYEERARFLMKV